MPPNEPMARSMRDTTLLQRTTATLALIVACLLLGVTIAWVGIHLLSTAPDTTRAYGSAWAVVGLGLGGILGGIAGGYLSRDLSVTARWWSAGSATLLAAGMLWSLALTVS